MTKLRKASRRNKRRRGIAFSSEYRIAKTNKQMHTLEIFRDLFLSGGKSRDKAGVASPLYHQKPRLFLLFCSTSFSEGLSFRIKVIQIHMGTDHPAPVSLFQAEYRE